MMLFDFPYQTAESARLGVRRLLRRKLRDAAIIVSLAGAAFAVAAQTIVDGPSTCGANPPIGWARFTDDALKVKTMYGTHSVPVAQCGSLQPGELCIGVFAYNLADASLSDVFTGPPPRGGIYPNSLAIDPNDQEHLLYITRDELIETQDRGQNWHHVNDMAAVRASAGRDAGNYFLSFTPDGLTLIEGDQVSDDSGQSWRTLSHSPDIVTHQSVYYQYGYTGAWRSNDRGSSWTTLMMNGYPFNLTDRWAADATDSSLVYAWVSGNFGYRIARSRDGGDNWTVLMNVGPSDPISLGPILASPDIAGLVYVVGDEYAANQVRMWKSTNGGDTWTQFGAQVSAHLTAAGCGSTSYVVSLRGVLDSDVKGVPLVFQGAGGGMILFDAPGAAPPTFVSAVSRRMHGAAGTFDLPLSLVTTNPTTEPRQGPAQSIVFTFDKPVSAATATITEGAGSAGTPTFSGNDVIVGLSGVTNQQYVTVALSDVAAVDGGTGGSGSARVGFLLADVNQNRVVTVSDLVLVNAQIAHLVTAANFLKDVNASGTLTVGDKVIANANIAKALPAP